MTNLYVRVAAILALLALLTFAVMQTYNWAYNNGVTAERGVWVKSQNDLLIHTQAKLSKLQREYDILITKNSEEYQKGLKDGQLKKSTAIAGVNAGTVKLRDKYAHSCPEPVAPSNAPSSGHNATPEPGLSRQTSEFLIGLASEADDTVKQLTGCQVAYKTLHDTCTTR
jgi:hypothetical protein